MSHGTTLTSHRPARILIVDDHPLVREGLTTRISAQSDMEVCGEADGAADALAARKTVRPDLVIIDISLKSGHGIELVKDIKSREPKLKMLVLSAYDESLYAERALRAGALGYLNKQECREKVLDAIRTVLEGKRYLSPTMTDRMVGQAIIGAAEGGSSLVDALSDRELEVFQLIGQGLGSSDIATRLHLSVYTIDSHREKIKRKLNLRTGTELTQRAVQWVLENI